MTRKTNVERGLYKGLRAVNDAKAIRNGRIGRRIGRRVYGKITGRIAAKLFR